MAKRISKKNLQITDTITESISDIPPNKSIELKPYVLELRCIREACTHVVTIDQLNATEFGLSLRHLREDSGVSLNEMAGILKMSPNTLDFAEAGFHRLKLVKQLQFVRVCTDARVHKSANDDEETTENADDLYPRASDCIDFSDFDHCQSCGSRAPCDCDYERRH